MGANLRSLHGTRVLATSYASAQSHPPSPSRRRNNMALLSSYLFLFPSRDQHCAIWILSWFPASYLSDGQGPHPGNAILPTLGRHATVARGGGGVCHRHHNYHNAVMGRQLSFQSHGKRKGWAWGLDFGPVYVMVHVLVLRLVYAGIEAVMDSIIMLKRAAMHYSH